MERKEAPVSPIPASRAAAALLMDDVKGTQMGLSHPTWRRVKEFTNAKEMCGALATDRSKTFAAKYTADDIARVRKLIRASPKWAAEHGATCLQGPDTCIACYLVFNTP
jgi:hypothetical protein